MAMMAFVDTWLLWYGYPHSLLPFVQIGRITIHASPMSATGNIRGSPLSFPELTTPAAAPPTMAPMVAAGNKK